MSVIRLAFAPFVLLLICSSAHATLINAATCQQSDVAKAVAHARPGDTVAIPACAQTNWTTTLTITKCISIQGSGQGNTVLGDNVSKTGTDTSVLIFYGVTCPTTPFSIHDLTIIGVASDLNIFNRGHLRITGSGQSFHVFNITMTYAQTAFLTLNWVSSGLVDHVTMTTCGAGNGSINMRASSWGGASNGDGSWSDSTHLPGSSNAIYIEDNTWNCTGAAPAQMVDGDAGARWVARFNTTTGGAFTSHGTDTTGRERGMRWAEEYKNSMTFLSTQAPDYAIWFRSGSAIVWGNTFSGPSPNSGVKLLYCRQSGNPCGSFPFTPWGPCDGTGRYDQNTPGQNGYRCVDQMGAGTSNVIAGNPPHPVAWIGNILEPMYIFLNTKDSGQQSGQIQTNRDVYYTARSFNGTSGIGVGTFAQRPGTCTPSVGYWATDQGFWNNKTPGVAVGQLYKCTATNTWTLWYVPYTYPHPLQQQLPPGGLPPAKPLPKASSLPYVAAPDFRGRPS